MSANRVDNDFIQKVKAGVNLVEVVGQHVLLKKSGSNYVGLCPFHQERSPSFSVSEQKQLFHCYGCKKGGDVLKFVMELHGSSFSDAIEELAERAHVAMPQSYVGEENLSPEEREVLKKKREKTQLLYKLNRFAAKFYHDHLAQDTETQSYLRRRGVDEEMQQLFYLGSTPFGWSPLSKKLMDAKAPLDLAKEMGLIRDSTKAQASGIPTFDLFRDRVMFPILDVKGKVVAFGGRALAKTPDGPKYLNSTESPLFQKSKTLYGLFQSQKAIRAEDSVIVVEGYFDFLALYRAGFQNVVATCGTALSADHLKILKRFASRIIVLFDSDHAGQQATLKSMELGLSLGIVLYGGELPVGKDVDELLYDENGGLLYDGKLLVETLLKNTPALLDREIERCVKASVASLEDKSVAVKQIGEWLRLFQDPIGREVRLEKIARDLMIPRSVLEGSSSRSSGASTSSVGSSRLLVSERIAPLHPESVVVSERVPRTGQRPQMVREVARGSARPKATPPAPKLPALEVTLLKGALQGGEFLDMLLEARDHLPRGSRLEELVQQSDIRLLLTRIFNGEKPQSDWEEDILEPRLKSIFQEALFSGGRPAEKKGENDESAEGTIRDFQVVVRKALQKIWARFSQSLLPELTIQGDLSRSQEWLDVQNKIKELGNFYDQNE